MTKTSNQDRKRRKSMAVVGLAAGIGFLFATDLAMAASNWTVSLNSGSSGQAKAGAAGSLTITASAAATGNLLYPGSTGDVVVSIVNSSSAPVQIDALAVPSNTVYAAGYSDSTLLAADTLTCNATNSYVAWTGGGATGASVSLSTPLIVAANNSANPLIVTLQGWASMGNNAAAGCEGQYFQMPSLTGVTASVVAGTPTTSPATDH